MIVHCCHCTWCQRETGSAFVINAVIESSRVTLLSGQPELVLTPSASGRGQKIMRCPTCKVALWSHYSTDALAFVRVGTLDDPNTVPPDVHIYAGTKQDWVVLPDDARVFNEFYNIPAVWPAESRERARAARGA
ncbi:MAG TPA: GFA family protein [Rhizomicrobium sp.]|nr:GFA family protein [Rhizomicrobium sp.]